MKKMAIESLPYGKGSGRWRPSNADRDWTYYLGSIPVGRVLTDGNSVNKVEVMLPGSPPTEGTGGTGGQGRQRAFEHVEGQVEARLDAAELSAKGMR